MSRTQAPLSSSRKAGWGASVRSEGERSEPERRLDAPHPFGVPGSGGAGGASAAAATNHQPAGNGSAGTLAQPQATAAERSTEAPQPGGVPGSGGAVPNPEVLAKATRRHFSADYKRHILQQADACTEPGQLGSLLRREALYSSHLTTWRRQREQATQLALAPKKRGPQPAHPLAEQNRQLQRENQRLTRRLQQAELIIEIQKKASEILGIPLRGPDNEEYA